MVLLDNDQFLFELNKLFERSKKEGGHGSVFLTCKKMPSEDKYLRKKKPAVKAPPSCIFRATLGKAKISTTVAADQLEKFNAGYRVTLVSNMDSLKKKDKSKKRRTNQAMRADSM